MNEAMNNQVNEMTQQKVKDVIGNLVIENARMQAEILILRSYKENQEKENQEKGANVSC